MGWIPQATMARRVRSRVFRGAGRQGTSRRRRENNIPGRGGKVDERRKSVPFPTGIDLLSPSENVPGIEGNAEHVGGNEASLRCVEGNVADENAVDAREEPSLPAFLAQQDGGGYGEHTGDIVQTKHGGSTHLYAGNSKTTPP